jgi:hypothetical protein
MVKEPVEKLEWVAREAQEADGKASATRIPFCGL